MYCKAARAKTVCSIILPGKARKTTHLITIPGNIVISISVQISIPSLPSMMALLCLGPIPSLNLFQAGLSLSNLCLQQSLFLFLLHFFTVSLLLSSLQLSSQHTARTCVLKFNSTFQFKYNPNCRSLSCLQSTSTMSIPALLSLVSHHGGSFIDHIAPGFGVHKLSLSGSILPK